MRLLRGREERPGKKRECTRTRQTKRRSGWSGVEAERGRRPKTHDRGRRTKNDANTGGERGQRKKRNEKRKTRRKDDRRVQHPVWHPACRPTWRRRTPSLR